MKKLKVLMASLLMSSILISASVNVFAIEPINNVDAELYDRAVHLLSDLKVYEGVEAYTAADGFVRKDVFAVLITRLIGLSGIEAQDSFGITDVKAGDFAAEEIFVLMQMGILDVPDNGRYKPESFITYKEAVKVLVKVLGYDITVSDKTLNGYMSGASSMGLLKNVVFPRDERLQVKAMTMLLYNALFIDQMEAVFGQGGISYRPSVGKSFLESTYGIEEITGIITANSITSLNFDGTLSAGHVKISGKILGAGDTNAENLLGYKVKAFYDKEREILKSVDYSEFTDVVELKEEELSYGSFTYTYADGKNREKKKISSVADIIYNYEAQIYTPGIMVPVEGRVTLLDRDDDRIYDCVIIESIDTKVVQEYSKTQNAASFKYIGGTIDLDDYEYVNITNSQGVSVKPTSLVEWTVLDICESPSKKYVDITVSNEKVSGLITHKTNSPKEVTIGNSVYKVSTSYPDTAENALTVGMEITAYLNKYGKVSGVVFSNSDWYYGYIMKVSMKKIDGDRKYVFKIFSEEGDGTEKVYPLAEKVSIDRVRCDCYGMDKGATDVVAAKLLTPQLIRYKKNDQNEIKAIDTDDVTIDDQGIKLEDSTTTPIIYKGGQFMGRIDVNSSTKVFVVANSTDDKADADFYEFTDYSYFKNDSSYVLSSYKLKDELLIADVVVAERTAATVNPTLGSSVIVSKILKTYDEQNEEVVDTLVCYSGATAVTYNAPAGYCATNDIAVGDVVSFRANPKGIIEKFIKIYDQSTDVATATYATAGFNAEQKVLEGYAYNKDRGVVQVSSSSGGLSPSAFKVPLGSSVVVIFDASEKDNVTIGTAKDISDHVHNKNNDRIICIMRYQQPGTVYIYR